MKATKMKATDFRDLQYEDLLGIIQGLRRKTYESWLLYGPGTTREIAAAANMELLTFRPRTTELMEVGLVELVPDQKAGHEGIYQAVTMQTWQARREVLVRPEQLVMF